MQLTAQSSASPSVPADSLAAMLLAASAVPAAGCPVNADAAPDFDGALDACLLGTGQPEAEADASSAGLSPAMSGGTSAEHPVFAAAVPGNPMTALSPGWNTSGRAVMARTPGDSNPGERLPGPDAGAAAEQPVPANRGRETVLRGRLPLPRSEIVEEERPTVDRDCCPSSVLAAWSRLGWEQPAVAVPSPEGVAAAATQGPVAGPGGHPAGEALPVITARLVAGKSVSSLPVDGTAGPARADTRPVGAAGGAGEPPVGSEESVSDPHPGLVGQPATDVGGHPDELRTAIAAQRNAPDLPPALPTPRSMSATRRPQGALTANIAPVAATAPEDVRRQESIRFKDREEAHKELVKDDARSLGTVVAKVEASMFHPGSSSPSVTAPATVEARGSTPVEPPAVVASAHQAVEAALGAVDRVAQQGRQSVTLDLSVAGESLQVRVELRSDEIRATFRTDSPELRAALQEEWQARPTDLGATKVVIPVFAAGSGQAGTGGEGQGSRQQRQPEASPAPAFPTLAAPSRPAAAPASPVAVARTPSGHSHQLYSLA